MREVLVEPPPAGRARCTDDSARRAYAPWRRRTMRRPTRTAPPSRRCGARPTDEAKHIRDDTLVSRSPLPATASADHAPRLLLACAVDAIGDERVKYDGVGRDTGASDVEEGGLSRTCHLRTLVRVRGAPCQTRRSISAHRVKSGRRSTACSDIVPSGTGARSRAVSWGDRN